MLIEVYVEALLVDGNLADQVWEWCMVGNRKFTGGVSTSDQRRNLDG
jgi:hypothetical protein